MSHGTVLIVEDDVALRHTLSATLSALGFEIMEAPNGETALVELRNHKFEVVLLDLNMPGMGGMSACEKIRAAHPCLSIIVLTVRNRDEDKIAALDAGADDYVTKPFGLPELAARMRAGVRRVRQPEGSELGPIEIGELKIDPLARRLTKNGAELHLTPKEFELTHVLMRHAGTPITHHKLLSEVWGDEYGNEREYLRTYISQLRRKIEDDPSNPRYLLTENYIGYRFQDLL
ncbi:response regulator transcription factor [Terriglobus saanensis]|uniref:Two component transcriptional regulator, winged helix family n=1 Tax=Terriglobus saanensis (strain ATCC BAA-1853 / DSM 23119 / SP1PR4) TaxID=401053 RepID=E8UXA2_TERSS|nr:response regulator transcription factor [Terriglobus saanensis]ADV83065.1 two component transcriptional regulator, winged helix family [Terriglobus saanensis SP1PR4]